MQIGIIADDFTGASDIALTLAEAGFRVAQFNGTPDASAEPGLQAGVVALKSRTAPVDQAVAESLAACEWLLAQGCVQIVSKVCSTFDSTPQGNIGPVLDALADRLGARHVMVCPAFPENGRSVYQGHLFVGDRLLNESGMQDHPLTPMTDADLRRVLASQTRWPVAHVPAQVVSQGSEAVLAALPRNPAMVIVDAIRDADLFTIGAAARDQVLLCGGSGIALGLPANHGAVPAEPPWDPVSGPGVVLSGSCSRATRAQVARFRENHPSLEISAKAVMDGSVTAEELADWVLGQPEVPMVYSSADPQAVLEAQLAIGREASAQAIETLFARLAVILAGNGVSRIVVAGGETSGAVVSGLGARVLYIGRRIAPGVPLVRLHGRPLALALPSGNFGDERFFETALAAMEGRR